MSYIAPYGPYFYDDRVLDHARTLKPSARCCRRQISSVAAGPHGGYLSVEVAPRNDPTPQYPRILRLVRFSMKNCAVSHSFIRVAAVAPLAAFRTRCSVTPRPETTALFRRA